MRNFCERTTGQGEGNDSLRYKRPPPIFTSREIITFKYKSVTNIGEFSIYTDQFGREYQFLFPLKTNPFRSLIIEVTGNIVTIKPTEDNLRFFK